MRRQDMDIDKDSLAASRLASLLSLLQNFDYVAESLAAGVVGERGGWTVVTLLEAWKATLRLRLLLGHAEPGRLMSSFAPEEEAQESWYTVVRRVGATSSLRQRLAKLRDRGGSSEEDELEARRQAAIRLVRAGELLRIIQPVAYLVLIQLQRVPAARPLGPSASSTSPMRAMVLAALRRRLPWLVALALEACGLKLCDVGLKRLEETNGARLSAVGAANANEIEMRHRRALLTLFLVRPAARAAARIVLAHGAARSGTMAGRLLAGWCATALDLVDSLETSCWSRYFRTSERLTDVLDECGST